MMQIKSIILYNRAHDECRRIDFKLGEVNIITGGSNTGKSTIIQIVEYCLGYSSFDICEGVTRNSVDWYAVLYQVNDQEVLIAKPTVNNSRAKANQVYYNAAAHVSIPAFYDLQPNCNDLEVMENLAILLKSSVELDDAISEFETPLKTMLGITRCWLFQDKTTITNNQVLFHRQTMHNSEIRETLPYFLGIRKESDIRAERELVQAKKERAAARRSITQEETRLQAIAEVGQQIVAEAQRIGLVEEDTVPLEEPQILSQILNTATRQWEPTLAPTVSDDKLPQLQSEINALRVQLGELDLEIESVRSFIRETKAYSNATGTQVTRLESINLFAMPDSLWESYCPLCNNPLSTPGPTVGAIKEALVDLRDSLQSEKRFLPELQQRLEGLEQAKLNIRQQIVDKQAIVKSILDEKTKEKEIVQQIVTNNTRTAQVVGQANLYVRMTKTLAGDSSLRQKEAETTQRIEYLTSQFDVEQIEKTKEITLGKLSHQMSNWAQQLHLEHQGDYYFDLDKLTTGVRKNNRLIQMERMGSRSNWLGCHLITLMALHSHFIQYQSPVPSFLILDQPAQGYFPSRETYTEISSDLFGMKRAGTDQDREAVSRIFGFFFEFCRQHAPKFQIIILEHANLEDDPEFQKAIIDGGVWNAERALIPQAWIAEKE